MTRPKALVVLFAVLVVAAVPPSVASAWAPAGQATVHPGVQVFTEGAQCTSNFVFEKGTEVFLGQAAHCSGTGGQTETDTCAYNDLALIAIDADDVGKVNPSVPGFGGPTGVGTVGGLGTTVYSYGNSELRGGIAELSPKQGIVVQNEGGGWSHNVATLTPGIPGDSGSGFLNASGAAFGVLSTLQLAPFAGSNGIGDLAKELAYMRSHSGFTGIKLVPGTEPFKPNLVGAILGS